LSYVDFTLKNSGCLGAPGIICAMNYFVTGSQRYTKTTVDGSECESPKLHWAYLNLWNPYIIQKPMVVPHVETHVGMIDSDRCSFS
jgi:hypothetical protein